MDGITILNEMGGGFDVVMLIFGIFFGILALGTLALAIYGIATGEGEVAVGAMVVTIFLGLISALGFSGMYPPVQYEVTLEAGAVIDATKWEIVEQRGEIYVLEAK